MMLASSRPGESRRVPATLQRALTRLRGLPVHSSTAVGNSTCDNPCICAPKARCPARDRSLLCLNYSVAPAPRRSPRIWMRISSTHRRHQHEHQSQFVATSYLGAFDQGVSTTGDRTKDWTVESGNFWVGSRPRRLNGAPTASSAPGHDRCR
jgi:hypothetical protein